MEPKNPRQHDYQRIAALMSLGLVLPSSIIVGLIFGYFLDKLLGTRPWMLLLFFTLGVVSGFLSLFRAVRKYEKDSEDDAGKP